MTGRREIFDQAMRLGHSAAWDQQWDRAITAYRTALQEFPDEPNALTSLGLALFQSDKLDEALQYYQRAAGLTPGDPIAPEKCGEIYERMGRLNEAAQTFLAVAEVHLKRRDVQKAIENWGRVVRITPDNLTAHSRLALASERIGQTRQAVLEYIEVARIFQRARDMEKAAAAANRALQLDPQAAEARDAIDKLHRGIPLPIPERPRILSGPEKRSDTGPLTALVEPLAAESAEPAAHEDEVDPRKLPSPLTAAQEKGLGLLAELVFEEDAELAKPPTSVGVIAKGSSRGRGDPVKRAQAMKHLGKAIASHSSGDEHSAITGYERAVSTGLDSPIVNFMLGALYFEADQIDDARKWLARATNHAEVGVGALYGLGLLEHQAGEDADAFIHLLEALKRLDQRMVPREAQDALDESYESLMEDLKASAPEELAPVVGTLVQFLTGEGWEERVWQARQDLGATALDSQVTPLAELLANPGAREMVDSLRRVQTYMSQQCWSTAMEEAYFALSHSPTHLPVHVRMAEILTGEGKMQPAIDKYRAVAETYRVRGELGRATRIMHQVLKLSPLDVTMRSALIEMLVEQGKVPEALEQFIDLADTYYQLADLDSVRSTYADALLLAENHGISADWRVRLLHKIGDIDLQRLNWREALNIYEQIRNLAPDDQSARTTLIDLHFRLGNNRQAMAEVDGYLRQMLATGKAAAAISLLEELVANQPSDMQLVARLARLYQDQGRRSDAIAQYDHLGELQLQAGMSAQAAETIRTILALGPADARAYQRLLREIQP